MTYPAVPVSAVYSPPVTGPGRNVTSVESIASPVSWPRYISDTSRRPDTSQSHRAQVTVTVSHCVTNSCCASLGPQSDIIKHDHKHMVNWLISWCYLIEASCCGIKTACGIIVTTEKKQTPSNSNKTNPCYQDGCSTTSKVMCILPSKALCLEWLWHQQLTCQVLSFQAWFGPASPDVGDFDGPPRQAAERYGHPQHLTSLFGEQHGICRQCLQDFYMIVMSYQWVKCGACGVQWHHIYKPSYLLII